jgi:hypothetical protein
MSQQRTYTMVIDGKHGGWMVRQEGSGKEDGTVQMSWLKGGRFPEGVRVMKFRKPEPADGKENEVRFKPDGTCSGATIELGCGTRTTSMIIHPHNGRVVYGEDMRGMAEDQYEMGE